MLFILFLLGAIAFLTYYAAFKSNLKTNKSLQELYVYPGEDEKLLGLKMDSILCDTSTFIHLSKILNLKKINV